jgi:hypothetical protein
MKKLLLAASIMLAAPSAHAATEALRCTFPGVQFYVTIENTALPGFGAEPRYTTRIGMEPGAGDHGNMVYSPKGARVVLEFDAMGVPNTLTTIQRNGDAVHSRQSLNEKDEIVTPSQQRGTCVSAR